MRVPSYDGFDVVVLSADTSYDGLNLEFDHLISEAYRVEIKT